MVSLKQLSQNQKDYQARRKTNIVCLPHYLKLREWSFPHNEGEQQTRFYKNRMYTLPRSNSSMYLRTLKAAEEQKQETIVLSKTELFIIFWASCGLSAFTLFCSHLYVRGGFSLVIDELLFKVGYALHYLY